MQNYQNQNDIVLEHILQRFYDFWALDYKDQEALIENHTQMDYQSFPCGLELFITPYCNQACNYCYLVKHPELYPRELVNNQKIIENLNILINFLEDKNIHIERLDLFSGEIWGYPFGNEIFDILFEAIKNERIHVKNVFIPTNASFCKSNELMAIIEQYIAKFMSIGCNLSFSFSYDGIVMDEESRPSRNKKSLNKATEEFINNLFLFAKRNGIGFHPMISPYGIEKQIENYDEWIKLLKKYWPNEFPNTYGRVMQLETREQGWTDEKIELYLKWLHHLMMTDVKEYFNNDLKLFSTQAMVNNYTGEAMFGNSYKPYQDNFPSPMLGCSLGGFLTVRLGDLAIVPCHRTSYEQFVFGNYTVENDKIVGVHCKNLPLANTLYVSGFMNKPFCKTCSLQGHCTRHCLGANYEAHGELLAPEPDNCKLQKAKVIFLINFCEKYNIMNDHPHYYELKDRLMKQDWEAYQKWSRITQQLI